MKKTLRVLIPILMILAIAGIAAYQKYIGRTILNDGYVNGNTAGNLYNGGLFCEHGNTIYFSNPNDNYYLYSMNTAGGNVQKLCDDIASHINADDHYVYYVRNNTSIKEISNLDFNKNSLCRYDIKQKKIKVLDRDPSMYASLIGNYIYYIHYNTETASTLYRVKIDGSEQEQVDSNPYFTCSANGQYFYYNGIKTDHNIYQLDTATGSTQTICQGNFWMPSADNEAIYFLDCEQNYALMRLGRSQAEPSALVSDRIETYNVYGDTVFFQKNNLDGDAALCSIQADGSGYRELLPGNYENINVTSQFVYFNTVGQKDMIYKIPLAGGEAKAFNP